MISPRWYTKDEMKNILLDGGRTGMTVENSTVFKSMPSIAFVFITVTVIVLR